MRGRILVPLGGSFLAEPSEDLPRGNFFEDHIKAVPEAETYMKWIPDRLTGKSPVVETTAC